ncbi:MAG: hypothetical protein V4563_11410 [Pseudomonadota bacterium]
MKPIFFMATRLLTGSVYAASACPPTAQCLSHGYPRQNPQPVYVCRQDGTSRERRQSVWLHRPVQRQARPIRATQTGSAGAIPVNANPLHEGLAQATGERPRSSCRKYLIDRSVTRVLSFASQVDPQSKDMVQAIESLLKAKPGAAKLAQTGE